MNTSVNSIPAHTDQLVALRRFIRFAREDVKVIEQAMNQYLEWADELDASPSKIRKATKQEIHTLPKNLDTVFGAMEKVSKGFKVGLAKEARDIPNIGTQLQRVYERMLVVQGNAAGRTAGEDAREFPAQTYALGLRKLKTMADAFSAPSTHPATAPHENALMSCVLACNSGNKTGFKSLENIPGAVRMRDTMLKLRQKHPSLGHISYDERFPFLSQDMLAR